MVTSPAAHATPHPLLFSCQAKEQLIEKVQDYLEQKIRFADRMLVKYAIEKIQVRGKGGWQGTEGVAAGGRSRPL